MVCGKTNDNEPLKEFILQSPAPIDTAVKLSALYHEMSEKEKVNKIFLIIKFSFLLKIQKSAKKESYRSDIHCRFNAFKV